MFGSAFISLFGSLIHPGSAPDIRSLVPAVPPPVLSTDIPPPFSYAPRSLPPPSEFLPPLALPNLDDTVADIVLATAAAAYAVSDAAASTAVVPPVFRSFKRLSIFLRIITIFQIYS